MKRTLLTLAAAGLLTAVTGTAYADSVIHQRRVNQQKRIGAGVENGSLTPHETNNLERKEGAVNHEIARDRAKNGGNLTNKEKARVTHQQNRLSRQIYRDKHNSRGK